MRTPSPPSFSDTIEFSKLWPVPPLFSLSMTVVDMGVHTGNQPTLQQTVVHWYHWVYGVFAGANTTTSFVDVSNYLLLLGSLVGIGKPHWPAEYPGPLCFAWASLLQYVAPASAHRSAREPLFLPGWLDEVSKVTSSTVPSTFILEQCPKDYTCPWASAADSWGTERQEAGSGSKRSSQQAH